MGHSPMGIEGCIKVEHVNAHQNSLPCLESDWNQQADIPMCLTEMDTWVHEMRRHGVLQQCRDGLNLDIFLLYPLRHKMSTTVLSANKRDWNCRRPYGSFPRGKALNTADQCYWYWWSWMMGRRRYKLVLTGIDPASGCTFFLPNSRCKYLVPQKELEQDRQYTI